MCDPGHPTLLARRSSAMPPPRGLLLGLFVGLVLAGGSSPAFAQATELEIDRARSHIYVVTRRSGILGFLGHEHAILATEWSARVCYAADRPAASSASFTVPTASLVIDSDAAVELAGTDSRPDAGTVEDLQRRMLSPEFLDAEGFPELRFETRAVSARDDGGLSLEGALTLHGETHALEMPVEISHESDGAVRFRAHAVARMTRYGIEPESNLGVVDVADEFDIFVELVGGAGSTPCS